MFIVRENALNNCFLSCGKFQFFDICNSRKFIVMVWAPKLKTLHVIYAFHSNLSSSFMVSKKQKPELFFHRKMLLLGFGMFPGSVTFIR